MADYTAEDIISFGGSTSTTTYHKRGRDDGLSAPNCYVFWTSSTPDGAYPGTPTGNIVDETILKITVT